MNHEVNLGLSKEEALVFFDWLSSYIETESFEESLNAEQKIVLYNIECILESNLVEVLASDYSELLSTAKKKITS